MSRKELPNVFSTSAVDMLASSLGAAAILFAMVMTNSGGIESASVENVSAYFQLRQFGQWHLPGVSNNWSFNSGTFHCYGKINVNSDIENDTCSDINNIVISQSEPGTISYTFPPHNSQSPSRITISSSTSEIFAGELSIRFENTPANTEFKLDVDICYSQKEPHFLNLMVFDRRGARTQTLLWQGQDHLETVLKKTAKPTPWIQAFSHKLRASPDIVKDISVHAWDTSTITDRRKSILIKLTRNGTLNISFPDAGLAVTKNSREDFHVLLSNFH